LQYPKNLNLLAIQVCIFPHDVFTAGTRQLQIRSLGKPVMEKGNVTQAVGVIMEMTQPDDRQPPIGEKE
jgi:hypothetical protein